MTDLKERTHESVAKTEIRSMIVGETTHSRSHAKRSGLVVLACLLVTTSAGAALMKAPPAAICEQVHSVWPLFGLWWGAFAFDRKKRKCTERRRGVEWSFVGRFRFVGSTERGSVQQMKEIVTSPMKCLGNGMVADRVARECRNPPQFRDGLCSALPY